MGAGVKQKARIWPLIGVGVGLVTVGWGVQYVATGKWDRWQASKMSDSQLQKAVSTSHAGLAQQLEWAARQERSGRYDEAAKTYQQAANLDSSNPIAWVGWGRSAFEAGDWRTADSVLQKCVELWPDNAEARLAWAAELNATFRLTAAREQLAAGVRLQPNRPGVWRSLGELDMRLKRYAEAVEDYRRALTVDQRLPGNQSLLGWALLRAERNEEALKTLRAAVQENPVDHDARFHLGEALAKSPRDEDRKQALQEFNRVANFSTNRSRGYVQGARLWLSQNNLVGAEQLLEQALTHNRYDTDALRTLVEVLKKQGHAQAAQVQQERLEQLSKFEEARDAVLVRIDGTRGIPDSLTHDLVELVRADLQLRRLPEAQIALAAAARLSPRSPDVRKAAAELQTAMQPPAKAAVNPMKKLP